MPHNVTQFLTEYNETREGEGYCLWPIHYDFCLYSLGIIDCITTSIIYSNVFFHLPCAINPQANRDLGKGKKQQHQQTQISRFFQISKY